MTPIEEKHAKLRAITKLASDSVADFVERMLAMIPEDRTTDITATMLGLLQGCMLSTASLYGVIKATTPHIAPETLALIKTIADEMDSETDKIAAKHEARKKK